LSSAQFAREQDHHPAGRKRSRKGTNLSAILLASALAMTAEAGGAAPEPFCPVQSTITIATTSPLPGDTPPADPPSGGGTAAGDGNPAPAAEAASAPAASPAGDTANDNEIVVTADPYARQDPLQAVNLASYDLTREADRVLAPVALTYAHVVPSPIRSGLRNFLQNLHEPVVALNFLLQLKPGKAAETLGRFAINSTVGLGGVIDVAKKKPFKLPHRGNDFGDTLAHYGVGPGPYLYLPLIGPTTLRDLIGGGIDRLVLPLYLFKPLNRPGFQAATGSLHILDRRAQNDSSMKELRSQADPYAASRKAYLQHRQDKIDSLAGHSKQPDSGVAAKLAPNGCAPH
jgi:phospholipid-binding lipoprotein MlaA